MRGSLVVLILFNTSTIGNGFIHLSQQRTVMSRQKSIVHYRNPALSKMDVSSNIVGELRSKLIVFSQPNFQEESNDMELVDLEDYEMSDEMLSDIDSYSPGNWEVMKQVKIHNQLHAIFFFNLIDYANLLPNYKIKNIYV